MAGFHGVLLGGKDALTAVDAACAVADIVVVPSVLGPVAAPPAGCLVIDRKMLATSGALELRPEAGGVRLTPVRGVARIWLGSLKVADSVLVQHDPARMAADQ